MKNGHLPNVFLWLREHVPQEMFQILIDILISQKFAWKRI